jgi:hypothetical protein
MNKLILTAVVIGALSFANTGLRQTNKNGHKTMKLEQKRAIKDKKKNKDLEKGDFIKAKKKMEKEEDKAAKSEMK